MDLKEILTQLNDGFKLLDGNTDGTLPGNPGLSFLLRNGHWFDGRPLPARYRMRTPKMCYYNSATLVRRSKTLRYCEGYVLCSDLPFPIQHAWALDPADRIVDVTLSYFDTGQSRQHIAQYFGIVFEREHMDPKRRYSGLLYNEHGVPNLELWFKIDPEFRTLLLEC